jgi:phosphatidylglycerophosphate synthase
VNQEPGRAGGDPPDRGPSGATPGVASEPSHEQPAPGGAASWIRIDARGGEEHGGTDAATRVAGLALLTRHLRLGARIGCAGVEVVIGNDGDRRAVDQALAREPPPRGLRLEIVSEDARRNDATVLPAGQSDQGRRPRATVALRAVYTQAALQAAVALGAPPTPVAVVARQADVPAAEAALIRGLRKSMAHDGLVAYYVMRPLSALAARALLDTRITPNQVTLMALLCGVTGGGLAATGGYVRTAMAGLLVWLGAIIDCVDGDLARLRLEGSRLGQWLDTLADDVTTFALLAGLGLGLHLDGAGRPWLAIGVGGALLWAATEAKVYRDLHRLGLPIDTARYPWFFGDPSQGPRTGAGFVGRAFYVVGYLFKRDAFVTLIALALLLDWRRLATAALAAGNVVMFGLLLVHLAVTRIRARRARVS